MQNNQPRNLFISLFAVCLLFSCRKETTVIPEGDKAQSTLSNIGGNVWTSLPVPPVVVTGPPTTNLYNQSFSVNDKLYVVLLGYNQLWQYDPATTQWTLNQNSFFNFASSGFAPVFTYGNVVYFLNGSTKILNAYDFQTATWTTKTNFPGLATSSYTATSTADKGWIISGDTRASSSGSSSPTSQNWQYDFIANSWTQKASTPGVSRYNAAAYAVGDKIYFGTGISISIFINPITFQIIRTNVINADWWEYNTTLNTWTQKTNYGGGVRQDTRGFAINGKVYLGMGTSGYFVDLKSDFWSYDPATNAWTQRASYPPGNGYPPYNTMTGAAQRGYSITENVGSFWRYTAPYTIIFSSQVGSN
jgi:hypothetical protein